MTGMRTILSALIALVAFLLQQYGIDLNAVLAESGVDVEHLLGLADQSVNSILVVGGIVSAIWFRIRATTTVTGAPLKTPAPPPPDDTPGRTDVRSHWMVGALIVLMVLPLLQACSTPIARDTTSMNATERHLASVRDGMVSAYVSVTETRALTRELLAERLISVQTAQAAQHQLNQARSALDGARALLSAAAPDVPQAQGRLSIALSAIGAARAVLAQQRAAGAP